MLVLHAILLTGLGMFITKCNPDELNLNFQQIDYHLKFERVELVSYNKHFFKELSIATFKFNRTTPVVNASFTLIRDLGNDVVAVLQAYKFMSNEYRFFPMRFAADCCKALTVNTFGIREVMACGNFTGCPIMKGKYHICYWKPDPSKCPPFVPNGEYKLELQYLHSSIEIAVLNAYATVSRPIVAN